MPIKMPFISSNPKVSRILASDRFLGLLQILIEQDCKLSQLVYKAFLCKRYLNPDMTFDYIDFREKQGMISYQPFGRTQKMSSEGKWCRDGRQEIKPAKFVKQFLHPRLIKKFKDHEIAQFATRFKAFEESLQCDFIISDDIQEAYTYANYHSAIESCMTDKNVAPFYKTMGAKVLIARRKSGKLAGRAIYWPSVTFETYEGAVTGPFMDRVYAINEEFSELFIQWAKTNKVWYKYGQNNGSYQSFVSPEGTEFHETPAFVKCVDSGSLDDIEFYPYLDTFLFGNDSESLTNIGDENTSAYTYRNTNGDRYINMSAIFVIDYNGNRIKLCDAADVDGVYYPIDSPLICQAIVDSFGAYTFILKENAIFGGDMIYYHKSLLDNGAIVEDTHGMFYRAKHITEIDGKKWYIYDPSVCYSQADSRYYMREDCILDVMVHREPTYWGCGNTYRYDNFLKNDSRIGQCSETGNWCVRGYLVLDNTGRLVYDEIERERKKRIEKDILNKSLYFKNNAYTTFYADLMDCIQTNWNHSND